MKHFLAQNESLNSRVYVDSAGTIGFHTGKSPDPRMRQAASARGITLQHAARQFKFKDFEDFDLILVMDEDNLANVRRLDPQHLHHSKVKLFCDFTQNHEHREVPDPYYGGSEGFELVLDLLEDGCSELLQRLETNTLN